MVDPETLVIACKTSDEAITAMNRVMPLLDPEVRRRLNKIKLYYVQTSGIEGLFERVNNRTVSQILAQFGKLPEPIEAGEIDGVRYELFEAPGREDESK